MSRDHITGLHVQGLRLLEDIRLPLRGLTVLVGDNGTGKSSLLEALELLHKAALPGSFLGDQVGAFHGGLESVLRVGARELRLEARIEGGGGPLEYRLALALEGPNPVVASEELYGDPDATAPVPVIRRDRSSCAVFNGSDRKPQQLSLAPVQLALAAFGAIPPPAISRVLAVFGGVQVYQAFDVRPLWVAAERQQWTPMRMPAQVSAASEVGRLGDNLANAYLALKAGRPGPDWARTLDKVRLGLGDDVRDLVMSQLDRGRVELAIAFRGVSRVLPSSSLSDGELCYLAFVALTELGGSQSLVAIDEPESHLHPQLLVRVLWLLEELSRECPVVLATHSDRLLDALSEPAKAVVLCERDEHHATRLRRPDEALLATWLERYRGLGQLRAEGFAPHVFVEPEPRR